MFNSNSNRGIFGLFSLIWFVVEIIWRFVVGGKGESLVDISQKMKNIPLHYVLYYLFFLLCGIEYLALVDCFCLQSFIFVVCSSFIVNIIWWVVVFYLVIFVENVLEEDISQFFKRLIVVCVIIIAAYVLLYQFSVIANFGIFGFLIIFIVSFYSLEQVKSCKKTIVIFIIFSLGFCSCCQESIVEVGNKVQKILKLGNCYVSISYSDKGKSVNVDGKLVYSDFGSFYVLDEFSKSISAISRSAINVITYKKEDEYFIENVEKMRKELGEKEI